MTIGLQPPVLMSRLKSPEGPRCVALGCFDCQWQQIVIGTLRAHAVGSLRRGGIEVTEAEAGADRQLPSLTQRIGQPVFHRL
jgi:hypothetical protein